MGESFSVSLIHVSPQTRKVLLLTNYRIQLFMKKCIICKNEANAKGSHIVPASLIKNCVGKRYREESYQIDSNKLDSDIYFGRDNLKNTTIGRKPSHYERDFILCQTCEDKLADKLESKFATEFLQKFRVEKFKNNFNSYVSSVNFEIMEPKRLDNREVLAYFYSIILRKCQVELLEEKINYLTNKELEELRKFVCGYLYEVDNDNEISEYELLIIFDKSSDEGSYVMVANEFRNPALFYCCEAILILFTEGLDDEAKSLFGNSSNNINSEKAKMIVGPSEYYSMLRYEMASRRYEAAFSA